MRRICFTGCLFHFVLCYVNCVVHIRDLTHTLDESTVYWPGNPAFNFTILSREPSTNGYWYESNYFGTAEHGGTHVDSPSHFYKNHLRADAIPVEKLICSGVVIDVSAAAADNPDYQLSVQEIQNWESTYGRIPEDAIVAMDSGWSDKWPNATLVFNSSTPQDPATFHFPGFDPEATKWLVTNRKINMIAVDTPSTDFGQSTNFTTHQILGEYQIPAVENIANLKDIPKSGATIFVGVLKLGEGSGAPSRVVATWDDSSANVADKLSVSYPMLFLIVTYTILMFHR